MSKIKIILDNYHGCCYAGQVISGRLACHFNKPKKIREITVKCEGKEKTEWTETETYKDHNNQSQTRYQTYTGEHQVFLNRLCLVKLDDNMTLPGGEYDYQFSFLLPENLPSTYDGEYGYIVYTIKAVADRPWKFNYVSDVVIIVQSPIDLNKITHIRNSVTLTDEKQVCCFWCKSGPILITATVPHRGFAPAESVTCAAYIKNLSNVNIKNIKLQLTKCIEYKVELPSTKTRQTTDVVASTEFGRIGAHGEHNFTLELCIPANYTVPNFTNCALFKTKYTLAVEVVLPCPHINLSDEAVVTMGNIKLSFSSPSPSNLPQFPTPSAPALDTTSPTDDKAYLINSQENDASMAPPTYDEVMQDHAGFFSAPMRMPMPTPKN